MGRLNPEGLGAGGQDRDRHHVELQDVLVELLVELQPAALVVPADHVDVVHAEGAAGSAGEEDGGLVLADPVGGPGVGAVDDFLVGGVQHLEGGNDRARRQRLDLEAAGRELVHPVGEHLEVVEEGQGCRPARLHLERDRLLGRGGRWGKRPAQHADGRQEGDRGSEASQCPCGHQSTSLRGVEVDWGPSGRVSGF